MPVLLRGAYGADAKMKNEKNSMMHELERDTVAA